MLLTAVHVVTSLIFDHWGVATWTEPDVQAFCEPIAHVFVVCLMDKFGNSIHTNMKKSMCFY